MQLLFKQRLFSWFDSFDVYDEIGNTAFVVRGRLGWGHVLEIFDNMDNHLGTLKEEIFRLMPQFSIYFGDNFVGTIKKEFTFLKTKYTLDCYGLTIHGDIFGYDFSVIDSSGYEIMSVSKKIFQMTDTYIIDIVRNEDTLMALMITLAIDAAQHSKND